MLEGLFPGLTGELVARGCSLGDMLADARICIGGHRFAPGPSGVQMLNVSRPALEQAIRRRVLDLPPVRPVGSTDVAGLVTDRAQSRVLGTRVIGRADGSAEETVLGDLVVDATGRGSRLPVWLESLGRPRPETERLFVDVGYASRQHRLAPGALDGGIGILSGPTPWHPRGGALALIEDGRCLVPSLLAIDGAPAIARVGRRV